MSDDLSWVYAVHRGDGSVAYVGKSVKFPALRFREHLRDAVSGSDTPFHRWLRHLIVSGDCPRVSTIETVHAEVLDERELYWIRHHHADQVGETLNVSGVRKPFDGRQKTPLSREETDELAAILVLAEKLAEESLLRAAAEAAKPDVDVISDHLNRAGNVCRAYLLVPWEAKRDRPGITDSLVMATALQRGWVNRGSEKYPHLVRLGTDAERMTDPDASAEERVRLFLKRRTSASGLAPGLVCDATLLVDDDVVRVLAELGWTKTGRGLWYEPKAARK